MRPARILLAFLLAAFAFPAFAAPDEELLGKAKGYPLGTRANWFFDEGVRVGSFSHLDELLPHYSLSKAQSPMPLPAAAGEARFDYRFENQTLTLDDFLAHQRVTGLLVIKDGAVLFERYQYDRKPADRFISHSMAKSIVSLGVGIALAEGKIASLDDLVSKYVPKLAGSAYGETTSTARITSGAGTVCARRAVLGAQGVAPLRPRQLVDRRRAGAGLGARQSCELRQERTVPTYELPHLPAQGRSFRPLGHQQEPGARRTSLDNKCESADGYQRDGCVFKEDIDIFEH